MELQAAEMAAAGGVGFQEVVIEGVCTQMLHEAALARRAGAYATVL